MTAPQLLIVAHTPRVQRKLLRELRILGMHAVAVSRQEIAQFVLELRGFDLLLFERLPTGDWALDPAQNESSLINPVPRLEVSALPHRTDLTLSLTRDGLRAAVEARLDRKFSSSFLPFNPSAEQVTMSLLRRMEQLGIQSAELARQSGMQAGMVAIECGMSRAEARWCALGTMLRRVGLVCTPSPAIDLQALDPLRVAREVINAIPCIMPIRDSVLCYRERFNGTGRPQGLAADEIPLASRIIAAVDAYQMALSCGQNHEAARERTALAAGDSLDPAVTAALLRAAEHRSWPSSHASLEGQASVA